MKNSPCLIATMLAAVAVSGEQARAPMGTGEWNPPHEGKLAAGQTEEFEVELQEGHDYMIHGSCDDVCNLVVRDPEGDSVGEDQEADAVPIVEVEAAQSGRFEVEISCPDSACEWEVETEETRAGALGQNEDTNIPIQLQAGTTYQVSGLCDLDCAEMDLRLRGPDKETVAEDVLPDSVPVLHFEPEEGGEFTLVVEMIKCSVEPCYWRVLASPVATDRAPD